MKTKTVLLTVITLFLLMGGAGCKPHNDVEDECIFDVNNPTKDLEWLRNKIPTTTSPEYSFSYYLYQNKKNPNKYYFIELYLNNVVPAYTSETIYNCNGDELMMKAIEGMPPNGWEAFFEENTPIKQIWPPIEEKPTNQ